ncbi:hypothetical protein F441_22257 [Phytophthora nicotianae CJ01A1]|uniref:Uncharacterized protein n=1 Tax=Phytophthora nicotianae CJ01A1 TaxID=1317063 RepID=W2VPN8_PHYNI|nr:hypothetical protein F441_22257 [Phytophthora nicotianae CJ01A1]
MPTTFELLHAENQEQNIEAVSPSIHSVEEERSLISNECPVSNMNISFEMCVLRIEERDRSWRLDFVGRDDEREFEKILEKFNLLDVSRRHKCVSQLTIWKNRDEELNQLSYRPGFSYRFERVHSLKLMYGNPMGSTQIRQRIDTKPLIRGQSANNENAHLHVTPCADVSNRED